MFIQQSYCHDVGVCPSVVHPLTEVSQKPLHGFRSILWVIAMYPPYLQTRGIFFFKIFNFQNVYIFFFFFVSTGSLGEWKFQNTTPLTVFIQFQPNFMISMLVMMEAITFLPICQILWHFLKFFLTQDHMGLEMSKRYWPPTVFIWFQINVMRIWLTMAEYRLLLFLAIDQV